MVKILIGREFNKIFLRLLMFIYLYQRCYIRLQSSRSYTFGVTNGIRQVSIFIPNGGFNTYVDPMIQSLRISGFSCTEGQHFFGAVANANNVLIMASCAQGLQKMVDL